MRRFCKCVMLYLLLFLGVVIALSPPQVSASTGTFKQINFQGKIVNKTVGTNIADGDYTFVFSLYTVSSAGSNVWTETKTVTVTNGIFQTLLGDTTALPGSVDFNTDNLYLGINFNGDGEMSPRVRFAAVPQAMNALKVAGLTVTDTTGTLTVPNGTTIAFSGANNTTFTTSGATNVTLPTTGTLTTLAGSEIFINKTIGSTGLVFSGATTDIDTDAAEGLVMQGRAASALNTTSGNISFQAGGTGTVAVVQIGAGGSGSTTPDYLALDVKSDTGDPAGGAEGEMYYNTFDNVFRCYQDTAWTNCIGAGGSSTLQQDYGNDADGSDATISLTSADDSLVITNPSSSGTDSSFTVQLNQSNTTAAVSVLDLNQSSNNANGLNLTANSIDGETGLVITANALTSGKGVTIDSSSTAFTGALQQITLSGSNAANTGSVLKLSNTGTANANTSLYVDHQATGTNNLAMRVDDQSEDTTPVIIDGDGRLGVGTSSIIGTTERLLQVGSATNRGNSATYGEVVTKGFKQIKALTNVKDVYIYDTSLDSDGGRWIDWADTEKLSWFTESLDDSPSVLCNIATMDRCYSDRFPRKAMLVVTTDSLYIFDATNGNMWMKFSQNASGYALGVDTNNDPSSVTALNGVIYVGTNGSAAGGLYVLDFLNDRMWNIDGTDRSGADVGIGSRNGVVTYASDNNTSFDIATVGTVADWGKINDVSVTVLKNSASAIAATTGPNNGSTIVGLATDSGLTIINLTTQKVTQYSDATDNDYNAVVVTPTGKLYGLNEALGQAEMWQGIDFNENVATKVNGTPDRVWDENSSPPLSKSAPTIMAGAPDALDVIPKGSAADGGVLAVAATASNSDLVYIGTNQGLTEIDDHATAADGWSKFYNTTRQTPFMIGAIRRMLTMDDASGNVTNQAKTSIMTAKNTPTYGVQGVRGTAMSFNGTSQFLCSDSNSDGTCDNDTTDNMSTGGWTISTWFKHSATIAGTDVLFSRCYNTTPAAAAGCVAAAMTSTGLMGITVDFDATFTIGAATSNTVYHQSVQAYNDNQWHFLSITRAATTGNVNTMIDGKPIGQTAGVNTTLDAAQIFSIGADCSVGAACATGANFWDGSVDDFQFSANGSTTASSNVTTVSALHRLYNDSRPLLNKKVIRVTAATTASSTTIGDSGESWIPQEFAGTIVTLTGGTGSGQTRRIVSNTATVLTVSPAFTTVPDTTTDFKMDPEALYGATNSVTAVGVSKDIPIGEARMMCAGTNDGADGGGITCYNHQAGPNVIADIYHSNSKYLDDLATEWTGTDYDDIQSIDMTNRTMVFGSMAHLWMETQDIHLGNALDYFQGKLTDVRNQIQTMGLTTLAGQIGLDVGLSGGADLSEYYTAEEPLDPGMVVSAHSQVPGAVDIATTNSRKNILGVVATAPGLVLGPQSDNSYPIALSGRVPVKVTTQNGMIKAGDQLTISSIPGYAMKTVVSNRVIGFALEDVDESTLEPCQQNAALQCGTVTMFVNLMDYSGTSVNELVENGGVDIVQPDNTQVQLFGSQESKVMQYLAQSVKDRIQNASDSSEIYTDTLSANTVRVDTLFANKIKANQIEGLEIYTDKVNNLSTLLEARSNQLSSSISAIQNEQSASESAKESIIDLALKKITSFTQGIRVQELFESIGSAIFRGPTDFLALVTFKKPVQFEEVPTFNTDAAGYALVKKGATVVEINFERTYDTEPVINATYSLVNLNQDSYNQKIEAGYCNKDESIDICEDKLASDVLKNTLHFAVASKSRKGFKIILSQPADDDIQFSWNAVAVKDVKTYESKAFILPTPTVTFSIPVTIQPMQLAPTPIVTPSLLQTTATPSTTVVENSATSSSAVSQ